MSVSEAHVAMATRFVAQAATRPMSADRKRAFAVQRTQAGTKLSMADAEAVVDRVLAFTNDPPPDQPPVTNDPPPDMPPVTNDPPADQPPVTNTPPVEKKKKQ